MRTVQRGQGVMVTFAIVIISDSAYVRGRWFRASERSRKAKSPNSSLV